MLKMLLHILEEYYYWKFYRNYTSFHRAYDVHTNSALQESSIFAFRLNFTCNYVENVIANSWRMFLLKSLTNEKYHETIRRFIVHTNSALKESSIFAFRLNFTCNYVENVIAYSWRIFLLKILTKLYVVPSCIQRAYKQRFKRIIDFCISFEFHVRLCWKCYCIFLKNIIIENSIETIRHFILITSYLLYSCWLQR